MLKQTQRQAMDCLLLLCNSTENGFTEVCVHFLEIISKV